MIDNRNMIIAVVLSIVILLSFDMYFSATRPPPPEQPAQGEQAPGMPAKPGAPTAPDKAGAPAPGAPAGPKATDAARPTVPGTPMASDWNATRKAALQAGPRIRIGSPRLHGSIALKGGALDDLTLIDYRETLDRDSPEIVLLIPRGTAKAYFAEFGWVAGEGQPVPDADTLWQADGKTLAPNTPVTLTWDNGQGLRFSRTIAVDNNYMFTVTQKVENTTNAPATLYPYALLSRRSTPEVTGFYIIHEGLMGVADSTLSEIDYEDIREKGQVKQTAKGGWIGITDKYWLAALVPDRTAQINSRFVHREDAGDDVYQVDYLSEPVVVQAGGSAESRNRMFAGAKEVKLVDGYNDALDIDRFDLAIDFGWFYFLTKPIFYALLYINDHVGNFGLAILLLTVAIKLAFFPLANKSYVAMSKMKKLQPEIVKLRDRFGDDKVRLNEEMMALYKREKANPASGCLPILIQIPVFFALYKVLFVNIEMRHAPFYGWIKDLSVADPTSLFNVFGLIPWAPPEFLMVGAWPLLMGITMFLQQKLNPQPTDPMQAKIFLFLPIMFTFLLAQFPAGLVIYWTWNNILSMLQQWVIMRRMGIKPGEALK